MVASLIAAFLSTLSTLVNWGASYLSNDLYKRFIAPAATEDELIFSGRVAAIVVTMLGAMASFIATDIGTMFQLAIALGTGPGLVFILRWFWWRINAAGRTRCCYQRLYQRLCSQYLDRSIHFLAFI